MRLAGGELELEVEQGEKNEFFEAGIPEDAETVDEMMEDIVAQLDSQFSRKKSMRIVMEWSWETLSGRGSAEETFFSIEDLISYFDDFDPAG